MTSNGKIAPRVSSVVFFFFTCWSIPTTHPHWTGKAGRSANMTGALKREIGGTSKYCPVVPLGFQDANMRTNGHMCAGRNMDLIGGSSSTMYDARCAHDTYLSTISYMRVSLVICDNGAEWNR